MAAGIVFDLDDTLYLERDYIASGFRAVVSSLRGRYQIEEEELYDFLWENFLTGVRTDGFDRLLNQYPLADATVAELVEMYRSHTPVLKLDDSVRKTLESLRVRGYRLGIITDGRLEGQIKKVAALGVQELVDEIIYTDRFGIEFWKPHSRAFELIASTLDIPHENLAYVADNPLKDFVAPNRLGWQTIRLRDPNQLRSEIEPENEQYAPAREISNLAECELLF
jgi:putative hydrolase of the HAD superfamily